MGGGHRYRAPLPGVAPDLAGGAARSLWRQHADAQDPARTPGLDHGRLVRPLRPPGARPALPQPSGGIHVTIIVAVVVLFALLFLGLPIAFGLGVVAFAGIWGVIGLGPASA